jgi:c-di-GMP-binding flagellar brake protein YcgR
MSHDERRTFLRVPIRLPAQLRRLGADASDQPVPAQTLDISGGGLQVTVDGPLGMHDRVRIELCLSDPAFELAAEARVVRVSSGRDGEPHYALAFERLERRAEQRIVQLVFAEERRAAAQHSNVRLALWLPVLFRPVGAPEPIKARTFDLSADDLRLITRERLELGARLQLRIEGNADHFKLETAATVVAVENDGEGDGRLLVTAQFDPLDRITRSRILRFAIEEERRQEARRQAETA